MNNRVLMKAFLILFLGLFGAQATMAHTALAESTPADGAMLMQAPENLHLTFTEEVRLMKIEVTLGEQQIELDFKPSSETGKQFEVNLPALQHGNYQVQWTVMGADSHVVEGKLGFMVGMMADGHGGQHHQMPEHHGQGQHAEQQVEHQPGGGTNHDH